MKVIIGKKTSPIADEIYQDGNLLIGENRLKALLKFYKLHFQDDDMPRQSRHFPTPPTRDWNPLEDMDVLSCVKAQSIKVSCGADKVPMNIIKYDGAENLVEVAIRTIFRNLIAPDIYFRT